MNTPRNRAAPVGQLADLLAGLRSWTAGLPHHKAPGLPGLYAVELRFDSPEQIKAWMLALLDIDTPPPSEGKPR